MKPHRAISATRGWEYFATGLRNSCKNEMAPAPEFSVFVSMTPELCIFVTWLPTVLC